MTDYQKSICYQIAENYGEQHQMLKSVEEMAELTQAILDEDDKEFQITADGFEFCKWLKNHL